MCPRVLCNSEEEQPFALQMWPEWSSELNEIRWSGYLQMNRSKRDPVWWPFKSPIPFDDHFDSHLFGNGLYHTARGTHSKYLIWFCWKLRKKHWTRARWSSTILPQLPSNLHSWRGYDTHCRGDNTHWRAIHAAGDLRQRDGPCAHRVASKMHS